MAGRMQRGFCHGLLVLFQRPARTVKQPAGRGRLSASAAVPPPTDENVNHSSGSGAFGPFRVLHQIGVGVLGPVYRAYDPSDDRPFIVKELRLDVTPEQARLLVEALERPAAGGPLHAAIVMPVAVGIEEGTPFLVQEFIAAPSLDVATRRGAAAEPPWALALLDELGEALDAAHARGLLHGALHLRDIFVADGLARMTGFGVAAALAEVGMHVPQRRPYTAPELAAGKAWGPEADRYALALVACALLTGRRPAGNSAQAADDLAAVAEAADSSALRALLAAALAAAPERRPASAAAFAADLRAALGVPAEAAAELAGAAAASAAAEAISIHNAQPQAGGADSAGPPELEAALPIADAARDVDSPALAADHGLPARLPPAAVRRSQREAWPWWAPAALAAAAGLVIVALAAAYVAGLRLGGNMAAPTGVSDAALAAPVVQEFPDPEPDPAPPALPQAPPPEAVAQPQMPGTRAIPDGPETPEAPNAAEFANPAAPDPGSGWLLVRTTPPGAAVRMDGNERGVTPLSIGDVPFGSRIVEVRREGFHPATREIALSAASPVAPVDVTLSPLPAIDGAPPAAVLGSLVVESRPTGARVTVAGSSAGTTPTIVSGLAAGPHEVRIELDGYQPWITSVEVQAAGEVRVAASLEGMGAR